ncbi:MAG: hypothetical protein GC171_06395 [Terrimonas sp.]|nr:hypothetical protein [Terrimonas sp.]
MKIWLPFLLVIGHAVVVKAQKVDSIFFNLYTDSLKKGTHNYINVDGKMNNGRWMPLTAKEIIFTSDKGRFEGNDLVIPADCKEEKIRVTAVLRANPGMKKEITIWVKQKPEDELVPAEPAELKRNRNPRGKN